MAKGNENVQIEILKRIEMGEEEKREKHRLKLEEKKNKKNVLAKDYWRIILEWR